MADVNDVAAAIIAKQGPMTAMKLEKLTYYSQAWHATWEDNALFPSRIEAWRNGPVCLDLYAQHRGEFQVDSWPSGNAERLEPNELESIEVVLNNYGELSAQQLSDLTHAEGPWKQARTGLEPFERGNAEITVDSMVEFYSTLLSESSDERGD